MWLVWKSWGGVTVWTWPPYWSLFWCLAHVSPYTLCRGLVSVMRRKTTPLYFTMATASLLESVHWRVKLLTPWNFCTVLHHLQWIHSPKIPKGGRGGPPCLCCVLVSIRVPVCLWYQCLDFSCGFICMGVAFSYNTLFYDTYLCSNVRTNYEVIVKPKIMGCICNKDF